jgi:hypothetical protein
MKMRPLELTVTPVGIAPSNSKTGSIRPIVRSEARCASTLGVGVAVFILPPHICAIALVPAQFFLARQFRYFDPLSFLLWLGVVKLSNSRLVVMAFANDLRLREKRQ